MSRSRLRVNIMILVLCCLGLLAGCQTSESPATTFKPLSVTADLDLDYALRGDVVFGKIFGDNTTGVEVSVGGVPASVNVLTGNTFEFTVPQEAPTGRQQVTIGLESRTLAKALYVLGDDVADRVFSLTLAPGTSEQELAEALEGIDYELVSGPYSLGSDAEVCSGDRVEIQVSGMGTGQALTELNQLSSGGVILGSDPLTGYSSGATAPLSAIGGRLARSRGLTGTGTMIAVLDTGVSDHPELSGRILASAGYDFVDLGSTPNDEFPGGHGTPVAVLAAGSLSGVAPGATILPVRVCDEDGTCYSDDVLAGICHSLATAERDGPGIDDLVLNLSFGGETPVDSIARALAFAVERGASVAASAGNSGHLGSPPHYPAAHDVAGVVVTGALDASLMDELLGKWSPAPFSNRGSYIDVAAPGVALRSGTPNGLYATNFTGTSYASAFTAGALALWQEVHPEMSPVEIETSLKAAADPLPYPESVVGAGMLDLSTDP